MDMEGNGIGTMCVLPHKHFAPITSEDLNQGQPFYFIWKLAVKRECVMWLDELSDGWFFRGLHWSHWYTVDPWLGSCVKYAQCERSWVYCRTFNIRVPLFCVFHKVSKRMWNKRAQVLVAGILGWVSLASLDVHTPQWQIKLNLLILFQFFMKYNINLHHPNLQNITVLQYWQWHSMSGFLAWSRAIRDCCRMLLHCRCWCDYYV